MSWAGVCLFLLLLPSALWTRSHGETCASKEFPSQRGNQNKWSGFVNVVSPAACIDFCCSSSNCVAADYDTVNSGCYTFSTLTELSDDSSYLYFQVISDTTSWSTTTSTTSAPTTTSTISTSTTSTSTFTTTTPTTTPTTTATTTTTTTPTTTLKTTTTTTSTTTTTTTTTSTSTTTCSTSLVRTSRHSTQPVARPETSSSKPSTTSFPKTATPTATPTTLWQSVVSEADPSPSQDAGIHTASQGVVAAAVTSTTLLAVFGLTLCALLLHGARLKKRQRQRYDTKTVTSPTDIFTVAGSELVTATNYTIYHGYNHFTVSTENISIKQLPELSDHKHKRDYKHLHQHHHHHHPSRVQSGPQTDLLVTNTAARTS